MNCNENISIPFTPVDRIYHNICCWYLFLEIIIPKNAKIKYKAIVERNDSDIVIIHSLHVYRCMESI